MGWADWIGVALLGGLGAVARWGLVRALTVGAGAGRVDRGVLAANVLGSLLLGLLVGSDAVGAGPGLLLALGFCGALTTWSTPVVSAVAEPAPWPSARRWMDLAVQVGGAAAAFGLGWLLARLLS